MKSNQIYKDYEDELHKLTDVLKVDDSMAESMFSKLLIILPNTGKLYKYKSLGSFHVDELKDKYVWFSSANNLNDNKDCTLNVNAEYETESLLRFFLKDNNFRKFLVKGFYMELVHRHPYITPEEVEYWFQIITQNGAKIGKLEFNLICKNYSLTDRQRQQFINAINLYRDKNQTEKQIRQCISGLSDEIERIRNSIHVLSLTTSYKKDNMWAYYCNNEGICIEYDFNKINSINLKKLFIYTHHVRYGKKKKFSFVKIVKANFSNDVNETVDADKLINEQLLTKDKSWSTEDEWRILLYDKSGISENKHYVDMISAIYLDQSILNKKKTKSIIKLANKNGWKIYVRYFNRTEAEYVFKTLEEINRTIEKRD